MRHIVVGATILAALLLPASVSAQSYEEMSKGIYFEMRGGGVLLEDSDISGVTGANVDVQFDPGFAIEGAAGYMHDSGIRGEIALGYRRNDIEDITASAGGATISFASLLSGVNIQLGGQVEAVPVMANLYYGPDLGGGWRPFVGAGAGLAWLSGEIELTSGGTSVSASADDTVFAYQGMVGIDYDVPVDWGGLALGLRYVYFATEDMELAPGIEAGYASHAVMVGVRISR
jgi:opacity protein-like surface antigen